MDLNDLKDYFFDMLPFKAKSSADWILPASIGIGLGVAAGVGLGMLLAPTSGTETRRKLRDGAYTLKDKAQHLADNAKQKIIAAKNAQQNQLGSPYSSGVGDIR